MVFHKSVLGPILFLLYINDLPNALNLKTLLFANDTALFASGNDFIRKISKCRT